MSDVDWVMTRNDLIKAALSICGVIPEGEDPSADQQDTARKELDGITKYLQALNLFLWNYSTETVTLVAGTATYIPTNSDAIGIDQAYYLDSSGCKVFLDIGCWADWLMKTDPNTSGTVAEVYFNPNVRAPTVAFYPKPDSSVSTVYVRMARRLKDWDAAADNAAWPQWWFEPLKWKLAANLSHHYRLPLQERAMLEAKAVELINSVKVDNFNDRGGTPLFFTPG